MPMLMSREQKLARLYEASKRDAQARRIDRRTGLNPIQRFTDDFREMMESKAMKPSDWSLSRLFKSIINNGHELVEAWKSGVEVSLMEADAVDLATFSNITGQIVYSRVMDAYEAPEFVLSRMVPAVPTAMPNGEKIPGVGNLGDKAMVVDENKDYPLAGPNEDWIETPAPLKRGLIVPVTKEALMFDRTGEVLNRCAAVGEALGISKEKRLINALVDENVTTHRYRWKGTTYATYQGSSPWVNLKDSNALVDWTNIDAAEQLFYTMTDPNTGEPTTFTPTDLVCGPVLRNTALRILSATQVQATTPGFATSGNPMQMAGPSGYLNRYNVVSSALIGAAMATKTNWFLGNVPKMLSYMENWPITVSQAPPDSTEEFKRDIVAQFKASERGAVATIQPRMAVKNTVA